MTYFSNLPPEEFDGLRPSIAAVVETRSYEDGIIAWSPSNPRLTPLAGVASVVFQILDGSATVAELVEDIHEVVGVPEAVARGQLRRLLDQFATDGLLEGVNGGDGSVPTKIDLFPAPPNP
jgi:hypothetical protein